MCQTVCIVVTSQVSIVLIVNTLLILFWFHSHPNSSAGCCGSTRTAQQYFVPDEPAHGDNRNYVVYVVQPVPFPDSSLLDYYTAIIT